MYLWIKTLFLRSIIAYQVCQSYSLLILFLGGLKRRKIQEVLYYLKIDKCLQMELLEMSLLNTGNSDGFQRYQDLLRLP